MEEHAQLPWPGSPGSAQSSGDQLRKRQVQMSIKAPKDLHSSR